VPTKPLSETPPPDFLTVVAIAIVAYVCASIIHEGIGHGLTSVAVGAPVQTIASTFCQSATDTVSRRAQRAIEAGGTLANFAFGTLFWVLLRSLRRVGAGVRLFLWLSMEVNLLQAAGYLAVPTLIGFGDWIQTLEGLTPEWAWWGSLIAIGAVLYPLFAYLGVVELEPLLGPDPADRRIRLRRYTLIPYIAGGVSVCASGFFNPVSPSLIVISAAAATFGGASALAWLPGWSLRRGPSRRTPASPPALRRDGSWIALGAVALVVLVGLLGRGISFGG
jgi:hypothetical protein